ncbi:MAG: hypothetical protein SVU32_04830, partial [Candidatus Nanohaloarchaea archaeon]|nr:hypothetical protein [Candidatus Nanohaloarchaea archaeon]
MRRHRDWSCDPALGDLLEDQRAIYMAKLDGRTRDQQGYTKNDMTRQFPHDIDLADDVLAPVVETVGEDASMIDIGTGIGTFAVLGAHHGIQATGIERDELPYQVATGLQDTIEDENFLEAELAYVNDDFYDWAEDDDKTLGEADIVVAY